MPTIPYSTGPRLVTEPLPNAYRSTPDVAANEKRLAAGLGEASVVADRVAEREAQREAYDTQVAIQGKYLDYQQQYATQRQGEAAKGLRNDVDQWWAEAAKQVGPNLTPRAMQHLNQQLGQARLQALTAAGHFEATQLEAATDKSWLAGKQIVKSSAAATPFATTISTSGPEGVPMTVTAVDAAVQNLRDMNAQYATRKGLTNPAVLQALNLQDTTELHTNVIRSLQVTDPAAAQKYFSTYKDQINGEKHDEVTQALKTASAGLEGDQAAGKIWASAGMAPGKPVELDKLEEQARQTFPGDKARQDAAVAGIRQRTQAFEHTEVQRAAANTNTVWKLIDKPGVTMGQVVATPEWQALPGHEQSQIRAQVEQRAAVRESHALTAEQRVLTRSNLQDALLLHGNADAYNQYSKPDVLASMTVEQVGALRSSFGFEATQHLLAKREQVMSAEGRMNSNIDAQDFNVFAQALGLRPDEPNKSEAQKAALAGAQSRIETLIAQEQKATGKPVDRLRRQAVMRDELSRQVQVNPLFGFERARAVIGLTPDDVKNVVVPQADARRIEAWLTRQYAADPTNPELKRSDMNIRLWYLREKSRSAQQLQAPQ